MKIIALAAASAAALLAAAPALAQSAQQAAVSASATQPKQYGSWGVDLTARDTSVKPGDSFFDYASGGWYKTAVIPADQPSLSVGYDVFNLSQAQLRDVIETSARNPNSESAQKIAAVYNGFMDEARIEQLDDKPLQPDLARIRAVSSKEQLAELMGRTQGAFGGSMFGAYVDPDAKDPTQYAFILSQGGLGLPDRDYYLTEPFKEKKAAYRDYAARTLKMVGWPNAEKAANDILAMEMRIAEASWPIAERRDPDKTYNPMTAAELKAMAPAFPWDAWMRGAGVANVQKVVVNEKSAFPKIAQIYADTPLETLKAWEALQTVDQASPYLSRRFVDNRFAFRGTALQGLEENRPRWKRATTLVDTSIGEAVGQEYVKKYFPPESKRKMEELVANLKLAMAERIKGLQWMSPETKTQALDKLDKMRVRVGYPNKWREYSGLKVDAADLYGSKERSNAFEWAYHTGKLGQPVDLEEWYMTPQTVNAYSDGSRNVIVFPAAILQAPYFDPKADMAVNYGAIGGVIGHEISHGFDDQGRKIDATGAVRDWWTAEDARRFEAQAAGFGRQYDGYEPVPGMHINGKLTMGENIADLAGVLIALDAYHASLGGRPAPVIDGLTGDQRFFLAFAQAWRGKYRPDSVKQQVASDPHSPDRFRVIGPLRNVDAWYAAWNVPASAKYYLKPEERTRIW
ncbi:MAG: M13 family metallopeptidase [Alphaproteobacteria bacterium]|nr:M13 family metallopeptidase [Alphaproteobacteria bacterium]